MAIWVVYTVNLIKNLADFSVHRKTRTILPCHDILLFQHFQRPASLHELPADRDGGDGLLPGEVSPVWQDPPRQEGSSQKKAKTSSCVQETCW